MVEEGRDTFGKKFRRQKHLPDPNKETTYEEAVCCENANEEIEAEQTCFRGKRRGNYGHYYDSAARYFIHYFDSCLQSPLTKQADLMFDNMFLRKDLLVNAIGSFTCLDKFQKAIKIGKLDVSYEIYEIKETLKIS